MTPPRIAVVVPARNEQDRIAACLAAMAVANQRLLLSGGCEPARVVVVADRCTDRTAELAAAFPGVEVVHSDHGRVGAARAQGIGHLLDGDPAGRPTWIACTDADSRVPPDWLLTQAAHDRSGADLLLGMVKLDRYDDPLPAAARARWRGRHRARDGHDHVHGANLGVRLSTYLLIGGFEPVAEHEDALLVAAIRGLAATRVVSTASSPVTTSARRSGRTEGGFAGYLRDLLDEPA